MNAQSDYEPLDDDFIDYIARRQHVDREEARARLSEWLYLYFQSEGSRLRQRLSATSASAASPPAPR